MEKSAYDYDNAQLVQALQRAAHKVGADNVGFRTLDYFTGIVLARLEGLKPPFSEGDEVQHKPSKGSVHESRWIIEKVFYHGNGIWHLDFIDRPDISYSSKDFEKITESKACATV